MVLLAVARGSRTPEAMRVTLATEAYPGLAMNYQNDSRGDMAHDAIIVCYDGTSRVPRIVKRYPGPQRR
jgi:branched-chain amino acid transport system substrate-binding protein